MRFPSAILAGVDAQVAEGGGGTAAVCTCTGVLGDFAPALERFPGAGAGPSLSVATRLVRGVPAGMLLVTAAEDVVVFLTGRELMALASTMLVAAGQVRSPRPVPGQVIQAAWRYPTMRAACLPGSNQLGAALLE